MENQNNKNIVILLVDALRIKNLSLFGYHKETDRNIKELSKNSILFREHFSVSNATAPALTSILTGLYPNNHGIIHQLPYTKQEEMNKVETVGFWLPTYLQNRGYETICVDWVGLWLKKGFDFYGESDQDNPLSGRDTPFISAKETVDLAISRIKKTNKPFFLFTHFWDTHFPFPNTTFSSTHNEEDKEKMLNGINNEKQKDYLRKRVSHTKDLYTIQDMTDKYDLSIKNIDSEIGRLISFLKERDIFKDTIFLVLGDHGDNLTGHGIYFSHSGLFDDSIHVPMILHLPGFEKKEIIGFSQHTDIIPTIIEYLGWEKDFKFDGKSLIPLIKNDVQIREQIFAFDGLCNDVKAIRTPERKLIISKDNFCNLCKGSHHESIELYNLKNDPEESINIYSEEKDFVDILTKKNL